MSTPAPSRPQIETRADHRNRPQRLLGSHFGKATSTWTRAINVLLGDDDEGFLTSLRELVDRQPELHVVAVARNGIEAIEYADEHMLIDRLTRVRAVRWTNHLLRRSPRRARKQ
jgi:hypothetical protein